MGGVLMFDGLPSTILALAALVIAVAVLVLIWRRGLQRMTARLGSIEIGVEAVNRAVNHVPAGTPPIPQRLTAVEDCLAVQGAQVDWLATSLHQLADALGHQLPVPPPKEPNP